MTPGRSCRLHRSARPGCSGHAPITTPAHSTPPARNAATVSALWFRVPRAGGCHHHGRGAHRGGDVDEGESVLAQPDEQPTGALDEHQVVRAGELAYGGDDDGQVQQGPAAAARRGVRRQGLRVAGQFHGVHASPR